MNTDGHRSGKLKTRDGSDTRYAAGADALQALQLALEIIDVRVGLMEKAAGVTFYLSGDEAD